MKFHNFLKRPLDALNEGSTWAGLATAITVSIAIPDPYRLPAMLASVMAVLLKDPGHQS
jgi:hypothetical protein